MTVSARQPTLGRRERQEERGGNAGHLRRALDRVGALRRFSSGFARADRAAMGARKGMLRPMPLTGGFEQPYLALIAGERRSPTFLLAEAVSARYAVSFKISNTTVR